MEIETSDESIGPDQYRYVMTHAWWLGSFATATTVHHHLTEHVLHQWVPARPARDWLLDREVTGRQRWLSGSAEQARADGFLLRDAWPTGRFRAPYGDFYAELHDMAPQHRAGGWQVPTPEFLAGLPRDPGALLARLQADSPERRSYAGPFTSAVDALRTCLVPAELRASLYRALTGLAAVHVLDRVLDVDGRERHALVHDAGSTCTELLIDPVDGQFAGERDTVRGDARCGLTAGTVISSTAVCTGVVDALDERPAALAAPADSGRGDGVPRP